MKKLKIGIMTNQELADWFGIKPGTFSTKKKEKLNQLKAYADFKEVGDKLKKIKILKIYEDEYHKKGSQAYEKIKSKFDETWSEDGLDSCKRVSIEILESTDLAIASNTAYNYTLKSRNDLFGKPFQERGSLGSCRYIWCKQEQDGELRFLNDEEKKIKQFLIKKYFGDTSEKQIIVQSMVQAKEISKEEAWDVLTEMTNMKGSNFMGFLRELQEKIGCKVIRGTLVERLEDKKSAF